MVLKRMMAAVMAASVFSAAVVAGGAGGAGAATPVSLLLPQSTAFAVLHYSCGGIQEQAYATGFEPTSGYPHGAVYLRTTCSSGGRGSRPSTHTAWAAATWDYTGTVTTYTALSTAAAVNPTFSAYDSHGNEIYNSSGRAYLLLSPTFVPAPRITGLSVSVGPATGGTSVTIGGTGFAGATAVAFGGAAAVSFTVNSSTSVTAMTPATSGGTVHVTITTAGIASITSASDQFTFVAAPVVSGLNPNSGGVAGGTSVTITGAHFTNATSVYFGDTATGFFVNSDTSITASAPPVDAPDTVSVAVVSVGGKSATSAADKFTYGTPGD